MLDRYTIRAIAEEVVNILEERNRKKELNTREAAKVLGISPAYLRQIKDRFGYKKVGDATRGHLVFNAESLDINLLK